jgi:FkbM family methyltransferase
MLMKASTVLLLFVSTILLERATAEKSHESCAAKGSTLLQKVVTKHEHTLEAQQTSTEDPDAVKVVFKGHQGSAFSATSRSNARHAYFDLGANWANTLRLYRDVAPREVVEQHPWEVYAFEASPLIVPYLDTFVKWLNGAGSKPPLLWPPAGSTQHLNKYAERYGCPASNDENMRQCMFEVFNEPLNKMHPNISLMTSDVINSRIALASSPPAQGQDRFVLVPAAAGGSVGTLHLGHVDAQQMIRGGALDNANGGKQYDVPIADVASMLTENFKQDDYIVVKMDIEGGEFDFLPKLMEKGGANLIDLLVLECHPFAGKCDDLLSRWQDVSSSKMLLEGEDYDGWDTESTPEKYYPTDPRTQ